MPKIERLEDVEAWRKAPELASLVDAASSDGAELEARGSELIL
jgi:hypothetical protein